MYGIRSRWQANVVGRIFFVKALILPMVLWQGTASAWIAADFPADADTLRAIADAAMPMD